MPENGSLFDARDSADIASLARALYPHDSIDDGPYARVAAAILGRASTEAGLYSSLRDGLLELRVAIRRELAEVAEPELRAALTARESTPFFAALRPLVSWYLYNDREVWKALGYPGASFELGGYLHRGFDDLDWLPEPRVEEPAVPTPELGPLPPAPIEIDSELAR